MLPDGVGDLTPAHVCGARWPPRGEVLDETRDRFYVFRSFQGIELSSQAAGERCVIDEQSGLNVSVHRGLGEVCGREERSLIVNDEAFCMEARSRPRRGRKRSLVIKDARIPAPGPLGPPEVVGKLPDDLGIRAAVLPGP